MECFDCKIIIAFIFLRISCVRAKIPYVWYFNYVKYGIKLHFIKLKIKILKKLLFTLLGASLLVSCSSDDAKMKKDELTYDQNSFVLKDNISKVNLDVKTNFIPSHEKRC